MSIDFLKRQLLFAGLSEEDIDWLALMSEQVTVQAGDLLMAEGSPGDAMYIVAEGEFKVTKRSGDKDVLLALRGPGEVLGEIALVDQGPRTASVRALRDGRLFKISSNTFYELIRSRPAATLTILRTVMARLRNTESMMKQSEKMAALGTLSAGLAHELNNPAAAARRSAMQLQDAIARWQHSAEELGELNLDRPQEQIVNTLRGQIRERASLPQSLDPLTRSDRESELQDWPESTDVEPAWELAPALVSFDYDTSTFATLEKDFSPGQLRVLAEWLGNSCAMYALLDEISASAERISEIVKAVKSYSFLDQAPIQQVDVHEGLENTLTILRHKLKNGVHIVRDYAAALPRIEAYGSELNQVWTNIIDNACDAMHGQGELRIRTYRQDDAVVVELIDNGPGIPLAIQSRIFEAFYTTKPPGIGTGLGLHISYNIIQKHRGTIRVNSTPGETKFLVTLPIQIPKS